MHKKQAVNDKGYKEPEPICPSCKRELEDVRYCHWCDLYIPD